MRNFLLTMMCNFQMIALLQRLEEENKTNTYLVKDKLPKEISVLKKTVNDLQRVVSEPAMGQSDLENINRGIKETNAEINQLIEKRMVSGDPLDDKLSLFRQQVHLFFLMINFLL